jgi:hypothetical protein
MGQYIRKERNIFETVVSVKNNDYEVRILKILKTLIHLIFCLVKRYDEVNKNAEWEQCSPMLTEECHIRN